MKKLFRSTLSLLMAAVVIMSLVCTSFAADSSVVFNGKDQGFEFSPGSEYTDTDLFDNFKNMMPGQVLTEEITVKNASTDSDYIKLYIRAKVHDEVENPLSEKVAATGETVASMTELLSELAMTVWNGDTSGEPIFKASPAELGGFAESVLLGTFNSGESTVLTVQLEIPPTLDNRFQNSVGEVDWVFTAEMFDIPAPPVNDTLLTVNKVWDDNGVGRPESIKAELLRNGEYFAETVLSADNQWTYTWTGLDDSYTWTVIESEVPDGYTASYETVGNVVTITNTADKIPDVPAPEDKAELTVKKTWSGDEDRLSKRPESVEVTLYNGSDAIETVLLGNWNNWEYKWTGLASDGDWKVIETNVPQGYAPTYSVDGSTVTITNVASLIQTGQMNWPIPVLCGLGIMMMGFGGIVITRRSRRKEQQ